MTILPGRLRHSDQIAATEAEAAVAHGLARITGDHDVDVIAVDGRFDF
jgi:hypothetical protein